MANCFFVYYFR